MHHKTCYDVFRCHLCQKIPQNRISIFLREVSAQRLENRKKYNIATKKIIENTQKTKIHFLKTSTSDIRIPQKKHVKDVKN